MKDAFAVRKVLRVVLAADSKRPIRPLRARVDADVPNLRRRFVIALRAARLLTGLIIWLTSGSVRMDVDRALFDTLRDVLRRWGGFGNAIYINEVRMCEEEVGRNLIQDEQREQEGCESEK